METPASDGFSGIAIQVDFNGHVSEERDIEIGTFIVEGVHRGLRSEEQPLPDGGIDFHVQLVTLNPRISESAPLDEVREIGEALYAIAASLVASLWKGLIAVNLVPRNSSDQRVADWVLWLAQQKKG